MAITKEELLRRAAELVPVLRQRAAATERLRRVPEETVKELTGSGLLRSGAPERYGGNGLEFYETLDVCSELGRGCGSTSWCYTLWTHHNWWMGHFPQEGQEEYYATGPDTLCSSALNPAGAKAEAVVGGYRVSGRWYFSSGCDAANWIMPGIPGPNGPIWLLVPRSQCEIVDTWFVSGMAGTGSKDIVIRDAFVPAYRSMDPALAGVSNWTGWDLHGRVSYRVPLRCLVGWDLVAPLIGMAQGAIDGFVGRLRGTSGPGRTAESVALQVRLGEACSEVDTARAVLQHFVCEMLQRGAAGGDFSDEDRARSMRDKAFAARLCVRAVDRLFEASGAHGILDTQDIQRFHRDAHAASHHTTFAWDSAMEGFGRLALGVRP